MSSEGNRREEDNNTKNNGDAQRSLTVPQPRQPKNLQDLLRYAVEAGGGTSQVVPEVQTLDPERRGFLENAVRSVTIDITQKLRDAICLLKNLDKYESKVEEFDSALDTVADLVDHIDVANDFVKLGGFEVVAIGLNSMHSEVRWRIADILATCAQNNPFCQSEAMKKGFLGVALHLADTDDNEKCKTKALFAVANIVRTYQPALDHFVMLDGFPIVFRALESGTERLRMKAAFFLSSLLSENKTIIDKLVDETFIGKLVHVIKKPS